MWSTAHSPTVSRRKDAERLLERAHSQGGMGLVVDGLAGMGKTYFLHELMSQAQKTGSWNAFYIRADEMERDEPLAFIDRIVASGVVRYEDFVSDHTRQPLPVARALLQALFEDADTPPRLVLLDDAQWVDAESVRVLRYVMPRVIRRNIFLAFGVRSPHAPGSFGEFLLDAVTANPLDASYQVQPLSEANIRSLVVERFATGIAPRNVKQILESSGGSFLGVQKILDHLTPDEIAQLHTTWHIPIRGTSPLDNPLLAGYRSLSKNAQATTEIVCLAGQEISYPDLVAVANILGDTLNVAEPVKAGVLFEAEYGSKFMPVHALVGHAVRNVMEPQRVREVSAALAQVTTGYRAMNHALRAAQEWDEDLATLVDDYVHSATETGAFANADNVLQGALKLATDQKTRHRLLISTALVNIRAKTGYRLLPLAHEYEQLPPSLLRELIMAMIAAHRVNEQFPHDQVASILQHETTDPDEQSMQAFLAFLNVLMTMRSRNLIALQSLIPQAMQLFAQAPTDPAEVKNPLLRWMVAPQEYQTVLECYLMAGLHQRDETQRAIQQAAILTPRVMAMRDSSLKVDALVALAGTEVSVGNIHQAWKLAHQAVALMDHVDTPWSAGTARMILAHCEKLLGNHEQALAMVTQIQEVAYDVLDVEVRPLAAALKAALVSIMNTEDPAPALSQAQRLHELDWEAYGADFAVMSACEVARSTGDNATILAVTESRHARALRHTRRGFLTFRAHALLNTGQLEAAQELIAQLAQMRGTIWHEYWGTLEWLQARLAHLQGDLQSAERLYRIAITADDFPLPHALTLSDYGNFLTATHQEDRAVTHLKESLSILQKISAQAFIPAVMEAIMRIEQHHESAQDRLWRSLTLREQEIATLLMDGLSNQQIAHALVITNATVRFHVSNILRKLDITSRAEVARVLRIRAEPPSS